MVLGKRILVLNKSWMPVNTATVKRAICLMFNGDAYSVCAETYQVFGFDEWLERPRNADAAYVRGGSIAFEVPQVILLDEYNGVRHNVELPFSRQNLLKRDKFTCQYCGKRRGSSRNGTTNKLTIDHIVPRCKGGKTTWANCVTACPECNTKKDNKTLRETSMTLLSQPKTPRWTNTVLFDALAQPETLNKFSKG